MSKNTENKDIHFLCSTDVPKGHFLLAESKEEPSMDGQFSGELLESLCFAYDETFLNVMALRFTAMLIVKTITESKHHCSLIFSIEDFDMYKGIDHICSDINILSEIVDEVMLSEIRKNPGSSDDE